MAQMTDLSERPKLRLTGPQALWFLDQLVTNQVVELPEGSGSQALLLTPKGRVTAELRILAMIGEALVDVVAQDPAAVLNFLTMRVFATKVQIFDATSHFALLRVTGPEAGRSVALALGTTEPPEAAHALSAFDLSSAVGPHQSGPPSAGPPSAGPPSAGPPSAGPPSAGPDELLRGWLVRLAPPLVGVDVWFPAAAKTYVSMTIALAGVQMVSGGEYQAYRVTAGVPEFGVDYDSTFLPQEAAMERAVHFQKGCYLGQEAVAMTQRGKIKRLLRHLEFAGPAALGELALQGAPVGVVTSAAGRFGIGAVRTSVTPGTLVEGPGGVPVTVKVLPATVEGPSVPSARELRERLQG
ncbi:MAG: CAF17-like 4Fe-4S cluster assembly/insertion protein YgfZ [Actinomycetota bacterium]